jgi:hypothetical protein
MTQIIEQGLQVLGLHIMWRTRNLPDTKDVTPDDEKYIETLREQQDSSRKRLLLSPTIRSQKTAIEIGECGVFHGYNPY